MEIKFYGHKLRESLANSCGKAAENDAPEAAEGHHKVEIFKIHLVNFKCNCHVDF